MISQGEGFILQSRKYSRQNAGKSLSKYLLLKKNEFAYNHGASKAKPFGVTYRLVESSEARVPYVYHAFSITQGDLGFWSYALNTESIERQLQKMITSGVRMDGLLNISFEAYMSVSIPFPCVAEQHKIASLLSSVDETLDLCQRKLDLLTQAKKALVQQIFSRKLRFKADDGSDFPEWEEKKLGEIFTERVERSSTGELISVTINQGVVKSSDLDRRDNSSSDKSNYKVVRVGDIAYNSMRMWQGASGASQYSGILSPAYTVVIPRKGQDVSFWEYQFKSDLMLYRFTINSQGLTSDTWNLKYPLFSKISVQVPSLPEQQKIASCLSSADALINQARADLEQWREVKKSLLQQLFV